MLKEMFLFSILLLLIGFTIFLLNLGKNLIMLLIALEICILSLGLLSLQMSFILDDLMGSILTLILLALAGAESAFGLSLLVSYYNQRNTISIK